MSSLFFADGLTVGIVFLGVSDRSARFWCDVDLTPANARETPVVGRAFEYLECRLPLDTQVGTVTMPYDGYLSAAVYDPTGQLVRTLIGRSQL